MNLHLSDKYLKSKHVNTVNKTVHLVPHKQTEVKLGKQQQSLQTEAKSHKSVYLFY